MSTGGFFSFLYAFPTGFSCPVDVAASRMNRNCSGTPFSLWEGVGTAVVWGGMCSFLCLPIRGWLGEECKAGSCVLLNPWYFCTCCVDWVFCCGTEWRQKGVPWSLPSWRKGNCNFIRYFYPELGLVFSWYLLSSWGTNFIFCFIFSPTGRLEEYLNCMDKIQKAVEYFQDNSPDSPELNRVVGRGSGTWRGWDRDRHSPAASSLAAACCLLKKVCGHSWRNNCFGFCLSLHSAAFLLMVFCSLYALHSWKHILHVWWSWFNVLLISSCQPFNCLSRVGDVFKSHLKTEQLPSFFLFNSL